MRFWGREKELPFRPLTRASFPSENKISNISNENNSYKDASTLQFKKLPEIKNEFEFSNKLKKEIFNLKKLPKRQFGKERKFNSKFIFFITLALVLLVSFFLFKTELMSLTGFSVENTQSYNTQSHIDIIEQNISESQDYEWQLKHYGQLINAKLSGKLTLIGEGSVKVYLEDKLLLDSSQLENKKTVLNTMLNKQSLITGFAVEEQQTPVQVENANTSEELNPEENLSTPKISGLEEISLEENLTEPSPEENQTEENISEENPAENITEENITEPLPEENLTIYEIDFSNVCVETCDLESLNLNETSYTLRIELENASLQIDNFNYTILEEIIPEIPINKTKDCSEFIRTESGRYYCVDDEKFYFCENFEYIERVEEGDMIRCMGAKESKDKVSKEDCPFDHPDCRITVDNKKGWGPAQADEKKDYKLSTFHESFQCLEGHCEIPFYFRSNTSLEGNLAFDVSAHLELRNISAERVLQGGVKEKDGKKVSMQKDDSYYYLLTFDYTPEWTSPTGIRTMKPLKFNITASLDSEKILELDPIAVAGSGSDGWPDCDNSGDYPTISFSCTTGDVVVVGTTIEDGGSVSGITWGTSGQTFSKLGGVTSATVLTVEFWNTTCTSTFAAQNIIVATSASGNNDNCASVVVKYSGAGSLYRTPWTSGVGTSVTATVTGMGANDWAVDVYGSDVSVTGTAGQNTAILTKDQGNAVNGASQCNYTAGGSDGSCDMTWTGATNEGLIATILYGAADTTAPTVSLPQYTNATKKKNTNMLTLNVSVSDSGAGPSYCRINVNGTNSTIAVSMDSSTSGWCNSTAINLTNLGDGNQTIYAYANDTLGNTALNSSYVVWVDSTAPTVTLPAYTNATKYKNSQSLIVNISVADAGTGPSACVVNVATASTGNQTIAYSGGWCNGTYALTAATDGNQTINAYANDTLGNTALNNSYVVWIDSTAPTVTLPAYTNATRKKSAQLLTVNISVVDAGTGPSACVVNVATGLIGNQTIAYSGGWCNGTYALVGASDGNQTINAYANDTVNNFALNNSYVVWIDSTAPTVTLPAYTNATKYKSTQDMIFNISVADANPSYCSINVDGNTNQTVAVTSGWCNGTYSLAIILDGNKTIYAYANDTLGNTALNNSYVVLVDSTGPVVTLPAYTNATIKKSVQLLTVNISVVDAGVGASACVVNVATGVIGNQTIAYSGGWCNGTYALVGALDGNKTIYAYANDTVNNFALNNSYVVWIDSTAPTATFGTAPVDNYNDSDGTIIFDLKCNDTGTTGTGVQTIQLYTNTTGVWAENYSNASYTGNTWLNISVAGIPEGAFKWAVRCNDSAGNPDWTDTNRSFVVDTTAPTITHNSPTNDSYFNYAPYFNGTCTDAGVGLSSIYTNLTEYNTIDTTSPYNFTNSSGLSAGTYSARISCNDSVNNTNTSDFYFTFDVVSPTSTIHGPVNMTNTTDNTPDIDIILTDNIALTINYTFFVNDTGNKTGVLANNTATNITMDGLSDGLYRIKVQAEDNATNKVNSSEYWYTVDSTAPTVTLPAYTNATKYTNASSMIFNISVADAGTGPSACVVNVATGLIGNQTIAYSGGWCNGTYALTGASDGNQTINAYANDTVNNFALNNSYVVELDSTPPVVNLISPINYNNGTSPVSFNCSMTNNNLKNSTLYGNWSVWHANETQQISGTSNATNFTKTLADGYYTWNCYVCDSIGNCAYNNTNWTLTVDSTAPTVTLPAYTNATKYKNSQSLIVNISVADAGTGPSACVVNVATASTGNQTIAYSGGWCNGTYSLSGVADGNKTIYAYANDTLGNTALNNSYVVFIDSTAPTITHNSPTNDSYYNYAPYFNGTCTDAGVGLSSIYTNLTEYNTVDTTSPYNFTNSSGLSAGVYSVLISCNDTLNNTATSMFYFTFDSTAPTATINSPGNMTNTTDSTPDINITLTDNIAQAINYTFFINDTANKTGVLANNTATNITMDGLSDGIYRIKVQAEDNATNKVNSSEYWYKIDTTGPSVSNTKVNSTSVYTDELICINATATDAGVGLDKVWAYVYYPNATEINLTMDDDTSSCSGSLGDNIFGIEIDVGSTVGTFTINTSYANDSVGNLGYENPWPVLNVTVAAADATAPIASQGTAPVDNYNSSNSSVTFDMKCSDNVAVSAIQLWGNWSGTWEANYTNASYTNDTWLNITVTGIPQGSNHKWAVYCNDTSGLTNITDNRTFNTLVGSPTSCGVLSTPDTTVTLTQNVSAEGTCFNVTVSNVTLDCNGFTINYSASSVGYGVYSNSSNTTVKGCVVKTTSSSYSNSPGIYYKGTGATNGTIFNNSITALGNASFGIYLFSGAKYNNVSYNTIRTNGSIDGRGIRLWTNADYNTITNNNIATYGSSGHGIAITVSSNNTLISNVISTFGTTAYGIYFSTSGTNNLFKDTSINASAADIYSSGSGIQNFTNCTFNKSDTTITSTGSINVFWYADAYVNDSGGNAINSANVTVEDVVPTLINYSLTNSSGYIQRLTLREYWQNATSKYFDTNYTFNASKATYNSDSELVNLTTNKITNDNTQIVLTLASAVAAPTIDDISNLPLQNITEGGVTEVNFFVNVSDAQGYLTISNVNATFTKTGEETRYNSSCEFVANYNTTQANYSCTIGIWYWDGAGTWTVNATANDSGGLISSEYNETFELSQTTSFAVSPATITFQTIVPGTINVTSDNDPTLLNNTGNANIPLNLISIQAFDLHGEDNPSYFINSTNFSIGIETGSDAECAGNPLENNSFVNITGSILPAGNNSLSYGNETSGQEELYYCIKQISTTLIAQKYSTNLLGSWIIKIIASMVLIVPVRKRKNKLKTNLKIKNDLSEEKLFTILKLSISEIKERYTLSTEDIIKLAEEKSEEKTIPLSLFKEDLGALEVIVKYLKENLNLPYHEIAKLLNRDDRTVWVTYKNTLKKKKEKLEIKQSKISIPLSIFTNRKLSILESLVLYLREKGSSFKEISELINRDQRNIWTINSRVKKKFKSAP